MTLSIGSLFAGIGGLELGLEMALPGARVIWQAESDSYARAVLAKHWPEVHRYTDVREIDEQAERPDIICGGFPCFPAGTLVETAEGQVAIEDIREGDLVKTHARRYRSVVKTMRRSGAPLVEVRAMGALPVHATPEHPFYARRKTRAWDNVRRCYVRRFGPAEWVPAESLTRDHFVAQPLDELIAGAERGQTAEHWYLVGRWLGDGWIVDHLRTSKVPRGKRGSRVTSRVHKAIICCATNEAQELKIRILAAGYRVTESIERTVVKLHISSTALVERLRPFGRGAGGKLLPSWVFGLPIKIQRALWEGWIDSDGHRFPDGKISATTVSRQLAEGMARIARNITRAPVAVYRHETKPATVIEGRLVQQRTQYQVVTSPQRHHGFFEDGFCWVPVRSVTRLDARADVFNIEVEEDNSYVAGTLVVHNCQDISNAGKRAGITGERSGLWAEYARIVRVLRPPIVFIENVGALVVRGLDRVLCDLAALGLDAEWATFRASDVGAPHKRERLFLLAYSDGERVRQLAEWVQREGRGVREAERGDAEPLHDREALAHADSRGFAGRPPEGKGDVLAVDGRGVGSGHLQAAAGPGGVAHPDGQERRPATGDVDSAGRDGEGSVREGTAEPGGRGRVMADPDGARRRHAEDTRADSRDEGAGAEAHGRRPAGSAQSERGRLVANAASVQSREGGEQAPGDNQAGHCGAADGSGSVRESERDVANPDRRRFEGLGRAQRVGEEAGQPDAPGDIAHGRHRPHRFPPGPDRIAGWDGPQPAIRRGDDGVPGRSHRLRLLGNAVVPQQAALAFRTLVARAADLAGERAA